MRFRNLPVVVAIAVSAAAVLTPASALAATDTTSVGITGGTLDYTTPLTAGDFPATTLTGLQQFKSANISPYSVTDSRGGSAGWNLTIAASQFASGTDTLPAGSLLMALPPAPTTTAGNLGVAPVPVVTTAIDNATTQKFVSAAALPLSGAGAWTFSPAAGALTLTIPPAVAPGTYTSTITTTLATGP